MNESIYALIGVAIGSLATGGINLILQKRRFEHEKSQWSARRQGEERAKEILSNLLKHKDSIEKSFESLNKNVGGLEEDEVRYLLLAIGAKRSQRTDGEWWYLIERQPELIQKRKLKRNKKSDNSQDAS